uniref:Peptidyl-prolyl cis-trans isomerase n=1 Tax=uncultured bacterium pUR16A2 TaxID=1204710 RepID=R9R0A5_9BACT|nr:hypothetical protein [uncultured bacterium pUR16A2]
MKRIVLFSVAAAAVAVLVAGCGGNAKKAEAEAAAQAAEQARLDSLAQVNVMAKLSTLAEEPVFDINTNFGTIKVKLYSGTPKHRENFAKLALSGYYDGLLFHRVINGFMIQGGDPLTKNPENAAKYGTGGPDYTVPAEFVPEYTHKKGALAAARRGDAANPMKASSGSQFYIVQDEEACAQLNGDYTVFGETIEGFDVIDKIASVETNQKDCPLEDVKIISVTLAE